MLTGIVTVALGGVVGVVLLLAVAAIWDRLSAARDERFIERNEREEAEKTKRKGYVWLGGMAQEVGAVR